MNIEVRGNNTSVIQENTALKRTQHPILKLWILNKQELKILLVFILIFSFLPHFRYQMERKIFEELLELKRNQIRAGRANEQLLVKRLSDSYAKTINELAGLKNYDGPFTFKEFEKYLYSKFKSLWNTVHILWMFYFFCLFPLCDGHHVCWILELWNESSEKLSFWSGLSHVIHLTTQEFKVHLNYLCC